MEPTARCPGELPSELLNETAQLPDAQDPYPAVGATDGHDPPPELLNGTTQDLDPVAEATDRRRGATQQKEEEPPSSKKRSYPAARSC